jgi:Trk K+ transport system NAD-binding subunit
MTNPLLSFWQRIFGGAPASVHARPRRRVALATATDSSATIFLVLRRMRAPLIGLVLILAVSVLGLTLVPGQEAGGRPTRMSFFDAFYFMSFTATTIGFGEIPHTFTYAQRMWVVVCIYLTVIGWAYAIGTLFALLQDNAFRDAIALQRFTRRVRRLREPFLLIAGYGQTGELLGRSFDALGQRFVVIDDSEQRIESLELQQYHADVPGLAGDARDPSHLGVAGLGHDYCEGVLALTDDDEVNLAVTMSAALIRPELPVITRTVSPAMAKKMSAFGNPTVVNPFDRFGDHLRLAMRAPASYQLLSWLESGPGAECPRRGQLPRRGRWIICGYGRFGRELATDLRNEGLDVTIVDPNPDSATDSDVVVGDGSEPGVLARARPSGAVGFVAGTDNDTANLSLISAAARLNPDLFLAARQNRHANAPLFAAMPIDALLVPSEVVAHEVYAQLSTPLLWRFIQQMPGEGDEWAAAMVARIVERSGTRLSALWKLRLTAAEAPALRRWLRTGDVTVGHLLCDPDEPTEPLEAVALLLLRGDEATLGPADDVVLRADDELLFAGQGTAHREMETTMVVDAAAEYVVTGRSVPASWIWRQLAPSARRGRG